MRAGKRALTKSEANAKFYEARRAASDKIKLERGCADCGFNLDPAALDFDHRDPHTKSFTVSSGLRRPWPVVLAEIAKCDVVCANCHRARTVTRREWWMDGRSLAAPPDGFLDGVPGELEASADSLRQPTLWE